MTLRSRVGGVLLGASLVAGMGAWPSLAQDPSEDPAVPALKATTKAKAASKGYRRVPPNFGKVGLTGDQKEKIYEIRGRHQDEIEGLKAKIEEVEAREIAECEAVLLDSQRKVLADLRASGKTAKKSD